MKLRSIRLAPRFVSGRIFVGLALAAGLTAGAHAQDWTDAGARQIADAVAESWTHGLRPSDYGDAETLRAMPAGPERDAAAERAFLDLAEDLAYGRVDPAALNPDWDSPARDRDLDALMTRALDEGRVAAVLEALAPNDDAYQALRKELVYIRAISAGLIAVEPGDTLQPGDAGPRVDALRLRLTQEGLLEEPAEPGAPYDEALAEAVAAFQARHNLNDDGTAGADTLALLAAGPDAEIDALRANLERWRWFSREPGDKHIRVNLADYRLQAWRDGQVEREHRAMIGSAYNHTPVFSEDMSYLELNPVWYTPERLGRPWLSTFRSNPAAALNAGFRLVDARTGRRVDPYSANWSYGGYRVIQMPGPNNALGTVKFMFPNPHDIYIHDTTQRAGFDAVQRDESAGCVRVEHPRDLAWWILADEPGWVRSRMEAAFDAGRTRRIDLETPVPVHILYFTAVPDADGVRFIHDVYDRDAALIAALDGDDLAG